MNKEDYNIINEYKTLIEMIKSQKEEIKQDRDNLQQRIDKAIKEIKKELKENNHLSYGVALGIINILNNYEGILKGEE